MKYSTLLFNQLFLAHLNHLKEVLILNIAILIIVIHPTIYCGFIIPIMMAVCVKSEHQNFQYFMELQDFSRLSDEEIYFTISINNH